MCKNTKLIGPVVCEIRYTHGHTHTQPNAWFPPDSRLAQIMRQRKKEEEDERKTDQGGWYLLNDITALTRNTSCPLVASLCSPFPFTAQENFKTDRKYSYIKGRFLISFGFRDFGLFVSLTSKELASPPPTCSRNKPVYEETERTNSSFLQRLSSVAGTDMGPLPGVWGV